MRRSSWNPRLKAKPESGDRRRLRTGHARYVPRLEALEDRCLPSVNPVVLFDPGTTWQLVESPTNSSAGTAQVVPLADFNVTVSNTQIQIQFVQYAGTGNVTVVTNDTLTAVSGQTGTTSYGTATIISASGSSQFQFNLGLNSIQDGTLSGTQSHSSNPDGILNGAPGYNVVVTALTSSDGNFLKFTIAASDALRPAVTGSISLLPSQNQDVANIGVGNSPSSLVRTLTSGNGLSFWNSNGPMTFTFSFGSSSQASPSTTPLLAYTEVDGNSVAIFFGANSARDFQAGGVALPSGSSVITHFLNSQGKQTSSDRMPAVNFNSLVMADSGPGLYLTLSITQEIGQRSSSTAAQATWTGLRPPLEAPLGRAESPAMKVEPSSDRQENKARSIGHAQADTRPMEIMVSNLLSALPQAKTGNRAREIAQAAVRESSPSDFEAQTPESQVVTFWPWEQGGEADTLGNIALPLNELLDRIAFRELTKPAAVHEPAEREQNVVTQQPLLPTAIKTSRWGWLRLGEALAIILTAVGWPGAGGLGHWLGQFTSSKPEQRGKKSLRS